MRKRNRLEGHVWLKSLESDCVIDGIPWYERTNRLISESMYTLTGTYLLLVVCERVGTMYQVRCYPDVHARSRGLPHVASSYYGMDLRRILSAAVSDYDQMMRLTVVCEVAAREVPRWVA